LLFCRKPAISRIMDEDLHPALLPAGLRDILPPDADIEAQLVERLMATLSAAGYQRVKPPMVEYEASLLGGPGAAMAQDTFRLMDPVSHRMIGMRADMTLQVARIATTRLTKQPRPLRLSYAGQVLRVRGTQLRPERQFGQVGAELIGSDLVTADAEIVVLAADALSAAGVTDISVDLTLPPLVPVLLRALGVHDAEAQRLRQALDHKDAAALAEIGGVAAPLLGALMSGAGPAARALERLKSITLPSQAAAELSRLTGIVTLIEASLPTLVLTIDPVENRGFEYHSGLSFTLFARGIRGELGRGGRYPAGTAPAEEPSTGFTLYTDTVLRGIKPPTPARLVYLPVGTPRATALRLRAADWITVSALAEGDDRAEAERLGCSHLLVAEEPAAL
jgi:ATP phosphoribosyltransferase regulatory subunit